MASRKNSKPAAAFAVGAFALLAITVCAVGASGDDEGAPALSAPAPSPSTSKATTTADRAALSACRELAMGYQDATTRLDRETVASIVTMWSGDSATIGIPEAGKHLVKSATAGPRAWKSSASRFTSLCKKRGWKGLSADDRKLRKTLSDIKKSGRSGSGYSDGSSSGGSSSGGGSRRRGGRFW